MEQSQKVTPKFFFLSLGIVVTLITSVSAFLSLLFTTLDHALPDVLTAQYQYGYASYSFEQMRSSLAILIIMFPLFLLTSLYWNRAVQAGLGQSNEVLKRWVVYLIVFLASLMIAIDLVVLVRYFVGGEITARFIWKVFSVLVVSKLVGMYYLSQIGIKILWLPKRKNMTLGVISSLIVLFSIVYGFVVMGGPISQRNLRLDQRRIEDLQSIQYQVINYWQQKETLPVSLEAFNNPLSSFMVPPDPEFEKGRKYEYRIISDASMQAGETFELCATFSSPMPKGWVENGGGYGVMRDRDIAVSSMPYAGGLNDSWDHQEGRTCFERSIDSDLYPPFPKPVKN